MDLDLPPRLLVGNMYLDLKGVNREDQIIAFSCRHDESFEHGCRVATIRLLSSAEQLYQLHHFNVVKRYREDTSD